MIDSVCVKCGLPIRRGAYLLSPVSQAMWHRACDGGPPCVGCGAPAAVRDPQPCCRQCLGSRVLTRRQVQEGAAFVERTFRAAGLDLPRAYRVGLVDRMSPEEGMAGCLGLTRAQILNDRTRGVVAVSVLAGMPSYGFMSTLAHELGHVFLRQVDANGLPAEDEEGIAEFLRWSFLGRSGLPQADGLIDAMFANPDPAYGAAFRRFHGCVLREGFEHALQLACRSARRV